MVRQACLISAVLAIVVVASHARAVSQILLLVVQACWLVAARLPSGEREHGLNCQPVDQAPGDGVALTSGREPFPAEGP